jgi:long-chain fatty acid transport protein
MTHDKAQFSGLRGKLLAMTALSGLCAAMALPAADAHAAGFAIKEQSSTAQGNSFAGATAGAEDVTYMFYNPAGLTRHDENQAGVVLSYILVKAETDNADGPLTDGSTQDAGRGAFVPALYGMWSVTPDLKIGLGINAPFGLKTEYSQTWAGQLHAVESDLKTININPTIAYRLNDMVSIGAGLQFQHADATLSQMTDAEPDGNPFIGGYIPVLAETTGDDWGYGLTLGLLVEFSEATRLGLGYRSQIKHTLEGDFTVGGGQVDTITADLTTPDQVTAGFYHDLSDQFAVMAEVGWTGWSSLDEVRIVGDNVGPIGAETYDWEDVWFFGIGANWQATEQLKVRGGIAYDQSPIPEATRGPRIPGADRTWVSAGIGYELSPNFVIDAAYTHIFIDDSTVNAATFTADYENSVDIVVLQGVVKF